MLLRSAHNQLFFGENEVRLRAYSGKDTSPAHYQEIRCLGFSPTGLLVVSIDKGGELKVWDPKRNHLAQLIVHERGFEWAVAAAITDNGMRLALAKTPPAVNFYVFDASRGKFQQFDLAPLDFPGKILSLHFTDNNHAICCDDKGNQALINVL